MIDSHRHGRVKSSARERLTLEPVQINDNTQKKLACSAAVTRRPVNCDRLATGHQGNRTSDCHNIYKCQLITAAGTLLPQRAP
jgi:hypothetical protein